MARRRQCTGVRDRGVALLRAPNFADLADLADKILAFIAEWNEIAHPFNGTPKSFDKILNGVDNPWVRRRPHWSDALKAAACSPPTYDDLY